MLFNKFRNIKMGLFLITFLSVAPSFAAINSLQIPAVDLPRATKPVLYSYWAGWSNAAIPNLKFNGLILAFAHLKSNAPGVYSTTYSRSGNFQQGGTSPSPAYTTWSTWRKNFSGGGFVAYGGDTNAEFRGDIINATPQQLSNMAGEIKANVLKYGFNGVDLDIETWWNFTPAENRIFANQLAILVPILRQSLDDNPATKSDPIMLDVGWNSAGPVVGIPDGGSSYTGTMQPFYSNAAAMNAVTSINVMSYDIGIANFYSRLDLISNLLNTFVNAGVTKQKLVLGVQPYEAPGEFPPTPVGVVQALAQYIKQNNYSGMFMFGIGTNGLGNLSAYDYINAMKQGLGKN